MKAVWKQYASAIGAFGLVSLLCLWLSRLMGYEAIALVYLLSVVLLALFVNRGAILLGTTLTACGWAFLFAPPRFSFQIGSSYDRMMLATYFVVALTVGQLTARLRAERAAERQREESSRLLYELTRELAGAADRRDLVERALRKIRNVFGVEAIVLLSSSDGTGGLAPVSEQDWKVREEDLKAAAWACEQNEPAGGEAPGFRQAEAMMIPLRGVTKPVGVLALRSSASAQLTSEWRKRLGSFAQQMALALEQQRLREAEIRTHVLEESDRLGRALLNCVSHELRTPVSGITGAASSFARSGALNGAQTLLLGEIDSAATRLNRVVQTLLSAARLRSGQLRPQLDWCDIPELLQTALRNTAPLLAGHPVEMELPANLPLVRLDFVLMEQALANLLVNAACHTPKGTPIKITGSTDDQALVLEVADRGPGLSEQEIPRLFELFQRGATATPGGTGLGLAIVKGFVEAQGGRVAAANRPGGGAAFQISIPVGTAPEVLEEAHES